MKDDAGLSAELLGCPFCGETDFAIGDVDDTAYYASCSSGGHAVNCPTCAAIGPSGATPRLAVAAWNTRSSGQKPFDDGVREKVANLVMEAGDQAGSWPCALKTTDAILALLSASRVQGEDHSSLPPTLTGEGGPVRSVRVGGSESKDDRP